VQTLPSDPEPAPESCGLALAPFRGIRYAPDRVSGIANVTSPPYDVIGPDTVERLLASEPHNVVRLILPGAGSAQPPRGPAAGPAGTAGGPAGVAADAAARAAGAAERNRSAASTLRDWLTSGVLRRDPRPALYAYEQSLPANGRSAAETEDGTGWDVVQRGLIGALRLVPPAAPSVLPHEDVMPGPVEGRRELMEATQANLEPIFLLYDSSEDLSESAAGGGMTRPEPAGAGPGRAAEARGTATRLVDEVAATREPLLSAVTDDGIRHRLWAVTDPAEHALVAGDLAPRSALIADGHHRYAAYLKLQARRRSAGGGAGPWDYGLAFLVDSAAYPPWIGAIHRVIPGLPPARAAEMAKSAFSVRPVPGSLDGALPALADAGRDAAAFLITDGAEQYLLTDPRPDRLAEAMPADHSPRWQGLSASILRELLITQVWQLHDEEPEVVVVPGDAAAAVRAAGQAGGSAVICNPTSAADVRAVAANGERMPRKSTSFGPKPRTGIVMRTLAHH
jgi:uncharacterized protein (DUF1015 family)